MKITKVKLGRVSIPLIAPFKTALRTVDCVDDIIVEIHTDTGHIGYGEAAPSPHVTGDTNRAIIGAIIDRIRPNIIGKEIEQFEDLLKIVHGCIMKNSSAKAAIDIALYDLFGKLYNAPVYKLLGGHRKQITTDLTISVNPIDQMVRDSVDAINQGYDTLKIKVGLNMQEDIERLIEIQKAIGFDKKLRIDANQGWTPKEAVKVMTKMEEKGLNIDFIEQPVDCHDLDGLKYVKDHIQTPVLADESVFSPSDCIRILQMQAADLVNIKLMKTGGIYQALKICEIAELYGSQCMIGCMMEGKISVNAAIHLACAKSVITRIDLDAPLLCKEDPYIGGSSFHSKIITVGEEPGFGVTGVEGMEYLDL